jgi:hypothetical protein
MQQVICDTNIWYNIANGSISEKQLDGVQLYSTSVNIREIASTPNLINNIELVARVARAMHKHSHKVITSNPMEFFISLFYWDYEPNTETEMRLFYEGFNSLMNIDLNTIPLQNIIDSRDQIIEIETSGDKLAIKINTDLIKIRQEIKHQIGKKEYRKKDFTLKWKKFFAKLVLNYSKEYCDKTYELDLNSNQWNHIEFFLTTWEQYFKNNLEIGNWKFDKNDWEDLFNLIYVLPNRKYWTLEKKWNRIFEENKILKNYKFGT